MSVFSLATIPPLLHAFSSRLDCGCEARDRLAGTVVAYVVAARHVLLARARAHARADLILIVNREDLSRPEETMICVVTENSRSTDGVHLILEVADSSDDNPK